MVAPIAARVREVALPELVLLAALDVLVMGAALVVIWLVWL